MKYWRNWWHWIEKGNNVENWIKNIEFEIFLNWVFNLITYFQIDAVNSMETWETGQIAQGHRLHIY